MVDTVTFSTDIGGTGETFTSGSDPTTGMGNGGYLTRFFKILANVVSIGAWIAAKAAEVAANAMAAQNAAFTPATSTSPVTLAASGALSFLTQSGKTFPVGYKVRAASNANPDTHWMIFVVTSYAGTTLQGTATAKGSGTGSRSDWTFSPAGEGAGDVSSTRAINTLGLASGGGNLTADRTITVNAATVADVRAGSSSSVAATPSSLSGSMAFQTLTDAATIAWDVALGYNAKVTIAGNRTLGAPSNLVDGVPVAIWIKQDATGGRTMAWNAIFDFDQVGYQGLSGVAGKVTKFWGQYSADTGKIHITGRKAA